MLDPPVLRAENETRTRDPNLGKVVLYQLSYFRSTLFYNRRLATRLRVQRYIKFSVIQIFSREISGRILRSRDKCVIDNALRVSVECLNIASLTARATKSV